MTLLERLNELAAMWTRANERSLSRLATLVMNDGKFFTRLESPKADTSTATLEKFARFFQTPGNWPCEKVPDEALALAHAVGVSDAGAGLSPDISSGSIGSAAASGGIAAGAAA